MDYFAKGPIRPALFALSIVLCLGSFARTADALVSCTGNQTNHDGNGDSCTSSAASGGTSAATAGPGGGNTATSNSTTSGTATSSAGVTAGSDSTATSTASDSGTATSTANTGSTATSTATTSGTATSTASDFDTAKAFATLSGTATATATVAGSVVCVFATNSGTATGSDSAGGTCTGDAVVVSSTPGDSCNNIPVADTPCAGVIPSPAAGIELQDYFSNANTTGGQGFVNITSPFEGNQTATNPVLQEGEMCAMIYVLNTDQAVEACCGCPITADGLLTLSISGNLAPNPVASGKILHDGSIRILSTAVNSAITGLTLPRGVNCDAVTGACCDPTAGGGAKPLVPQLDLVAWANHVQNTQITEAEFQATPSAESDLTSLPSACAFAIEAGSGQGVCTCGTGGFGVE